MKLKLNPVEREFSLKAAPTERKVKGMEKEYWVLAFAVTESLSAEEVDELFVPENTEEMTITVPLVNGSEYSYTLSGYRDRVSTMICHAEDGTRVVKVELKKEA